MIRLEKHGAVAVMNFDRPEQLNAMTPEMRQQMEGMVIDVRDDTAVRALLITGRGRAFCSGGDVSTFANTDAVAMRDRLQIGRAHV